MAKQAENVNTKKKKKIENHLKDKAHRKSDLNNEVPVAVSNSNPVHAVQK